VKGFPPKADPCPLKIGRRAPLAERFKVKTLNSLSNVTRKQFMDYQKVKENFLKRGKKFGRIQLPVGSSQLAGMGWQRNILHWFMLGDLS